MPDTAKKNEPYIQKERFKAGEAAGEAAKEKSIEENT